MPAPTYMAERRYSYHVAVARPPASTAYEVASPESEYEHYVRDLFLEGQQHLHHEEYALALDAFEELQLSILNTAHPEMPVDSSIFSGRFPYDAELVEILATQAGEMLRATPATEYSFPQSLIADQSMLPTRIQRELTPAAGAGLIITSFHDEALREIELGAGSATAEHWDTALRHYEAALEAVPEDDPFVRGVVLHDMAVLADKADDHDRAVALGKEGLELLERANEAEPRVRALETMVGIFARGGERDFAKQALDEADRLRAAHNLAPIVVSRAGSPVTPGASSIGGEPTKPNPRTVERPADVPTRGIDARSSGNGAAAIASPAADGAVLMAPRYLAAEDAVKTYVVQGAEDRIEIPLDDNKGTLPLLERIATTADLDLLTGFAATPAQVVAYLPHMYFFIVPMAIGDCLAGLGDLESAEQTYRDTLAYPYINQRYEAVRLWSRLADVYLAMGDQAYRAARDRVGKFDAAKKHYEALVKADGSLDTGSPLYADASFAGVKSRIEAVLAAPDPTRTKENPDLVARVLGAKLKLDQIAAGLDFFGLAPDYLAPFGWEYLQTTARYFAQSASQIEQRYILFKSTAENEELRQEQLSQQADVAAEAVVLEQRALDEANAALEVAKENLEYADEQYDQAVAAEEEFEEVGWALLWLDVLDVLAQMAGAKKKDADVYAQLLANQAERAVITYEMEEARLDREVDLASAAKDVAEEQVVQAEARVEVAAQRLAIAQLQQIQAEENRDYLDAREFSARLWFDLAAQARAIADRYLDLAIQIAVLAERAYDAETERGLKLIRYDYVDARVGDLLAADRLLADIDFFTADYVTTVKSKKLPVKKVISLADAYPTAFQRLRTHGECRFATEFAHFDREHPGLYLCKLRNVELALVGITSAATVAGSLRNVGISRFRREDGSIVSRSYPPDVMPLSQYSVRNDALLFRFSPNDLKAFELNGIDALWRLELPPGANRFDLRSLLDVQLVLYYDGYFSQTLETSVKASLPASGASARSISLAFELPDELFYLKSTGEAEIAFVDAMFPAYQRNRVRTDVVIALTGRPATIGNLTMRLSSEQHGEPLTLTTGPDGRVDDNTPEQPLRALRGEPALDRWTVRIAAEDNPQLVRNGSLDLGGLEDLQVLLEYSFDYR